MSKNDLLGVRHRAVLEDLSSTLAVLRTGDVTAPRVVVLEGHSGTGKSRIVRELYSRLQAGQPAPGYWPELPEATRSSAGPAGDPFADRKRLGPSLNGFVWPAGTLPTFLWWAFNCDRMPHGDPVYVVAQVDAELRAHLIPASLAWRDAAGWSERIKASREAMIDLAREVLTESGVDAAAKLLESFSVAVPGLGLWASWLVKGARAVKHRHDQRGMIAADVDLHEHASGARSSAAEEIARLLLESTHVAVPAVVVIEDLHLMGAELGELIDRLAVPRADKPLLVVATVWPEGRSNPAYAQWRTQAAERGSVRMIAMPDLDIDAQVEMLRRVAPNTTDADASQIVGRYPNPLALQMLLSLKNIQRRIGGSGGALALTERELTELPPDITDLYRQRWRELPDAVREALMIAAGGLPGGGTPGAWSFLRDIVADAGGRSGLLGGDAAGSLTRSLEEAEHPYHWSVSRGEVDATVTAFRESVLADIAILDLAQSYDEEDIDTLQAATVTSLSEWVDRERVGGYRLYISDERALVAARWLWELTAANSQPTVAVSVAGLAVARAQAEAFQFGEAITTLASRPWESPLSPDHPDTLAARADLANWLGQAGRLQEAITHSEDILADCTRVCGEEDFGTLVLRSNLAHWVGSAGRVDDAITLCDNLLSDSMRFLGAAHRSTLTARSALAFWTGQAGRVHDAIKQFEKLLEDRTRLLGSDHHSTLKTRHELASLLGTSGRLEDALRLEQELSVEVTRVLGPDHHDTLSTRNNLASLLGQSGRLDEALLHEIELLPDMTRALGADHPDTLNLRSNISSTLLLSGRLDEAIASYRALVADLNRVVGADHPALLIATGGLASSLGEAGHLDESISCYRVLVADLTRILGPDHPFTLTGRGNLAGYIGRSGQVEEAVTGYEILVAARTRVLGRDHPDTLSARLNRASWMGQAGHLDDAVRFFDELVGDCIRALGPKHPQTLSAQSNLAAWRELAGQ